MDPMSTLVIVACGKRKIWDAKPGAGSTKAKDTYIGVPFRFNRGYAEKFSDRWIILSAKYGFIDPNFIVPANYDVTFKDPTTNRITISELKKQVKEKHLDRFDKIVVLGGRNYAEVVSKAFSDFDVKIIRPLAGMGLGHSVHKVRKAIEDNHPFDC